ncbi:MAG: FAD-dependent oxidoreductase, partial [Gemmatimonadetes bacterium]|nr:FAD-dependent oxidoreductase [Gemmatimonadota bacterium]NIR40821.1 FAD-dependent oxidoreductase [Actinomycetota bacterium]NIS35759.1 FAD-dependent oxidoreductase [Actinomycetota bacterium]NIU70385.1 FAD-dependent oxidoreductase [Actinomycetota bacterium]NIW32277.1 FAD-dependent oxidoreductase [Actinomycetota bacterium]
VYNTLYAPYANKLWGLPGEQIAGEQARRRVTADTPWKIAGRMLRGGSGGQGRVFYYPRRGFGQIVQSLADAASEAGAIIRTGTTVDAVEPVSGGGGVRVTAGASTHVEAAHVFSTIPLPALAAVTRPGPPPAIVDAARRLRFRAM